MKFSRIVLCVIYTTHRLTESHFWFDVMLSTSQDGGHDVISCPPAARRCICSSVCRLPAERVWRHFLTMVFVLVIVFIIVPTGPVNEQWGKGKKVKADRPIALHGNSISELRDVTCHMGSHSVICHPTADTSERAPPYPSHPEGWKVELT